MDKCSVLQLELLCNIVVAEALAEPTVLMPTMDLLSKFQEWFSKVPFTSA